MYGELLGRLADDLDAGGPTAAVLRGHEQDPGPCGAGPAPGGQRPPARPRAERARELATFYPSVGGTWRPRRLAGVPPAARRPAGRGAGLARPAAADQRGRSRGRAGGRAAAARPTGAACRCGLRRSAPPAGSTCRPTGSATSTRRRLGGATGQPGGARPGLDGAAAAARGCCRPSSSVAAATCGPVDVTHHGGPAHAHGVRLARQVARLERLAGALALARAGRRTSSAGSPRRTSSTGSPCGRGT